MTDADALLMAVLAAPRDDLPRLVFADWLEETGAAANVARAEYIRSQCESAREETADAKGRELHLLALYGTAWLAPLRARGEALASPATHAQFHRGFVEVVWMPAGAFVHHAAKLLAKAPVRELRVMQSGWSELRNLFLSPELARLETLDLSDRKLGHALARLVAQSPLAWNLKRLRLRACGLGGPGAELLAEAAPHWPLAELDVSLNPMPHEGLELLLRAFGPAVRFEGRG